MAKIGFDQIPNAGIREIWEYKTDILTTIAGVESRLSIRPNPRITQTCSFGPFDEAQRRDFIEAIYQNQKIINETPLYAHSAKITQTTLSGNNRVYFDPQLVPVADNGILFLINPKTKALEQHDVLSVEVDGAFLATNVTTDITSSYVAVLGMEAEMQSANVTMLMITGDANVTFRSWVDPDVQRPGTSAVLTTVASMPVVEKRFFAEQQTNYDYNNEIIDSESGIRRRYSQWDFVTQQMNLIFKVNRVFNADDMDYWRLLIDTVRGGWKPLLVSTQSADMTLASPLVAAATTCTINEDLDTLLHDYDIWKGFAVYYADKTVSYHEITDNTAGVLTFTPALPNDAKVTSVESLSHLLKGRMGDTLTFEHGHVESAVSFTFSTTESG